MAGEESTIEPITLDDYQLSAQTTAIYPERFAFIYPALGLVDEIGEMLNTDLDDPELLVDEMGDVMWYCAVLAFDLDLKLEMCVKYAATSNLPDGQALFTNAAAICGKVKKMLRGDGDHVEKVAFIQGLIGDIVLRLQSLAGQFEVTLLEVCERNLEKLSDRKERGVLKGDGDKR